MTKKLYMSTTSNLYPRWITVLGKLGHDIKWKKKKKIWKNNHLFEIIYKYTIGALESWLHLIKEMVRRKWFWFINTTN